MSFRATITLLGIFLSPSLANAQDLVGRASVIDGDTIEIHGQRIRLHGIDAPESRQLCEKNGQEYRCGQQASLALADMVG
jgi:endonuclease YncB( thermonuclease family)